MVTSQTSFRRFRQRMRSARSLQQGSLAGQHPIPCLKPALDDCPLTLLFAGLDRALFEGVRSHLDEAGVWSPP